MDSNRELDDYVTDGDYGKKNKPKIAVAILFPRSTSSEKTYDYTIRVNSTNFNSDADEGRPATITTPTTSANFDSFAKRDDSCILIDGAVEQGRNPNSCTYQYIYNGAITIQRLVHDWILDRTGSSQVSENGVQFVPFPTREYTEEGFYAIIAPFAGLLTVLGLLYPVSSIIRSVTQEKELRQKELMKMMSVTEAAIGWSWFISYFVFYTLCTIPVAFFANGLYPKADFSYIFFFWEFSFIAVIVFCFAVASLFSRASRATLVGVLVFFIGYFLTLAVDYTSGSTGMISLVSLHPVTAISYGLAIIGDMEESGVGVTSNTAGSSDHPSGYSFNNALSNIIFDCFLWGFLTFYLNRVIRGDFGQPLKWYFPFTSSYWCPGRAGAGGIGDSPEREIDPNIPFETVSDALKEQEREGRSVEVHGLTKHFGDKVAVNGLNLSMYSGQVTALLGHNGAGKTTTIGMLTGMIEPTAGYATVAGKDIRTQLSQLREGVGICLQHDCLFPLLTVKEHLQFFARIKGMYGKMGSKEAEESIMTAIEDVALLEKRHTFSKDLSGGMKRKLSVAIAFCGDSQVVFLDEPTSGMDPFSRRFTWNVIRQYRQDRCIILTTHFMDEADLLGDRIAIMAGGHLCCAGSPLFLKKSYGVGYQLTIEKQRGAPNNKLLLDDVETSEGTQENGNEVELKDEGGHGNYDRKLTDIVKGSVKEATLLSNVGTELSFQLPLGASKEFIGMFDRLDEEVKQKKIVTYGVGITTLDEVFLMVARGETREKSQFASSSIKLDVSASVRNLDADKASTSHRSKMDLDNSAVFSRHVQALFAKRAMNFKRDKKAWICSTILPSLFTFLGFLTVILQKNRSMGSITVSLSDYNPGISGDMRNPIPYNEPDNLYTCQPGTCIATEGSDTEDEPFGTCGLYASLDGTPSCTVTQSSQFIERINEAGAFPSPSDVTDANEASRSLFNTSTEFKASRYGAIYFTHDNSSQFISSESGNESTYSQAVVERCSQFLSENDVKYINPDQCDRFSGIGYTVAYNFTAYHSSVVFQALADEAIMRESTGDNEYKIGLTIHPLPFTDEEQGFAKAEDAFTAWFLLVLSFPFITGAFATFIVTERMSKAKHLQTVAGVKPEAYWVSSYMWDVMNYLLPFLAVIIMMFAMDLETFTTTKRDVVGGTIVTLGLFGPAAAGFTYCVSFLFDNPSACNLFVIVFNFFVGMAGPMVSFILRLIGSGEDDVENNVYTDWAKFVEWILRLIPSFNMGKSLFFIINIEPLASIYAKPKMNVWDKQVCLIEVIVLAIQSVLYLWLAIQMDKLSTKPRVTKQLRNFVNLLKCKCRSRQIIETASTVPDDDDVVAETERVLSGDANEDLIVINQLKKQYPNGKLAVNGLSLGIPHGQCFGLLGINGAGKTTTMAMLTAEFPPTSGDATLAGYSVTNEPEQTRRRIGYCPQFDAHFMNMTGREHVELYASIKGVPKEMLQEAAASKLAEVGLNEYDSNRLSAGYSGGMKRKLSVACATIGQPQIVFLDEPSTGMDPVARRDMWKVISDMVEGDPDEDPLDKTSVILTTHSMEECEALCPNIGIMAGGKLRCLGSAQHLKSRFGKGFQIEMKVNDVDEEDEDYRSILATILAQASGVPVAEEFDEESARLSVNTSLKLDQVVNITRSITNDDFLVSMISLHNPTGYVIYKAAVSPAGVVANELADFCVEELRVKAVVEFFQETYGESAILRERQDNRIRFEVESEGLSVSSIFRTIESNKEGLQLADYGVSQTSLEQVFNMHAAEAEKAKQNTNDG